MSAKGKTIPEILEAHGVTATPALKQDLAEAIDHAVEAAVSAAFEVTGAAPRHPETIHTRPLARKETRTR